MAVLDHIIVDNVNYDIQDAKAVPQTRTINNKSLGQDIVLDPSDVGVTAITTAEIDSIINSYGGIT